MCLQRIGKPESKTGFAYKVVRTTNEPDVFTNFHVGLGTAVYRLGETLELRKGNCKRECTYGAGTYPAAFHLYIEPVRRYKYPIKGKYEAHGEFSCTMDGVALVLFKYEKAFAQDGEQIVALKVTPIRVLKSK
jgi:hypothetical protein